jgi:hypothetical protein
VTSEKPTVLLRRYSGFTYDSALDTCEADLLGMVRAGYFPVGQAWGWDPETSIGFVVGGSSWKPGMATLAVTYRREREEAT